MDAAELGWIAEVTGAKAARRGERVQSLWSGYGEICRVRLTGAEIATVIVKSVKPPARARASQAGASHTRKCRSYDVERAWYRAFAPRCDATCRVPRLFGESRGDGASNEWLFVLEDLDAAGFPGRRHDPSPAELEACLAWLAALHARFLGVVPDGLWETGTYWHLETRPEELAAIEDPSLRAAAPLLDQKLRAAEFQTLVHGDAKPANFCFARAGGGGSSVAAVDFQYAGGGCGMKDVAYLLSGSCDGEPEAERRYLDGYFERLRRAIDVSGAPFESAAVEREWRGLYPIACADYHRFIAGWAKEHWRRDTHARELTRAVLRTLA